MAAVIAIGGAAIVALLCSSGSVALAASRKSSAPAPAPASGPKTSTAELIAGLKELGVGGSSPSPAPAPAPKPSPSPSPLVFGGLTPYSSATSETDGNFAVFDRTPVTCGAKTAVNQFKYVRTNTPGSTGIADQGFKYTAQCIGGGMLGDNVAKSVEWQDNGSDWSKTALVFLDRQNIACGTDEVITGFTLQNGWNSGTTPALNGKIRYNYTCAKSNKPLTCRDVTTTASPLATSNAKDLDKQDVKCASDEAMSQFKLTRPTADTIGYTFKCCK